MRECSPQKMSSPTTSLTANNQQLTFERVLLDTGSAATLFKTDDLERLGILPLPDNHVRFMAGVGGTESVIEKQIDALQVGSFILKPCTIYMSALDYAIPMDGILGVDFLLRVGARVDFQRLRIE
jgi:Aspartyl protease